MALGLYNCISHRDSLLLMMDATLSFLTIQSSIHLRYKEYWHSLSMWFKLQVLCRRKIHPEDHSLQPEEPYDVVQSLQPLLKVLDAIVLKANQSYEVRADHGTGNEFGIYISLLKGCHIKFTAYPSKRNNIKKPSVKAFVVAILWFALGIILSVWTELNWRYINNLKTLIMVVVVKKQFSVFASLR